MASILGCIYASLPPEDPPMPVGEEFLEEPVLHNGFYRVGDMQLTEGQFQGYYDTEEEREALRMATSNMTKRWTNGVMPYVMDEYVSNEAKEEIRKAVAIINDKLQGCLKVK